MEREGDINLICDLLLFFSMKRFCAVVLLIITLTLFVNVGVVFSLMLTYVLFHDDIF